MRAWVCVFAWVCFIEVSPQHFTLCQKQHLWIASDCSWQLTTTTRLIWSGNNHSAATKVILEVWNCANFYETLSATDEIPFFSFVQNSRGAGKGKVHSFGKRDQAIKRNLNIPVVVRGWLYKQVSWASAAPSQSTLLCCFIVPFTWPLCVCNDEYYVIKISVFLMSTPSPSLLWSQSVIFIKNANPNVSMLHLWTAAMLRLSPLYLQDSSGMRLWKRKWFVLSDYCLFYYKGESLKGHSIGHGCSLSRSLTIPFLINDRL